MVKVYYCFDSYSFQFIINFTFGSTKFPKFGIFRRVPSFGHLKIMLLFGLARGLLKKSEQKFPLIIRWYSF
jgi:hypothetical protein